MSYLTSQDIRKVTLVKSVAVTYHWKADFIDVTLASDDHCNHDDAFI